MSVTATANQPTASSGTITFSWTTANASSWSVLFQYATTVNGTYTTLSTTTGSASGLQTAAYTTPTTSYYYRTSITAQGTGGPATSTSTSLYYYNPFQGPQGVQGVQGIAGSDGLRGPDGPQGLQGIQGIVNFSGGGGNVANYVITTTNNAGTINANANMTYDGSIFVVTGTGAHKLGPVTFTNGAITSVTNLTGTGTLSMGNVAASGTTAHNLGLVTFTNGAITGVTTLNTITIGSTGNVSGMGTLGCGAITSSGALGLGANTITSGNHVPSANNSYNLGAATTGLWANVYATNLLGVTALNTITLSGNNVSGMGTLGCGVITAPTTTNTINGLVINSGALTGVTTLNTITIGSTGNVSGMGTLGCGAITTTAGSGITSGSHVPDGDNSRTLGNASTRWSAVHTLAVSPGSSTLLVTATTGLNTHTMTVNAPTTATCNAIYTSGTVSASDFTATSDRRLKSDISTISNALETVKALRGVYFTRLGETKRNIGVIAQEVEELLPEVVHGDDLKSVSYGNIVGLLIEAVKELSEKMKV